MKLRLQFKTPDVLDDFRKMELDENNEVCVEDMERLQLLINKYVGWGEYVTIELDSDSGKVTVLEIFT